MRKIFLSLQLALIMLVFVSNSSAQLIVPNIFGDHMVLQWDQKVRIWGWSAERAKIKVEINDQVHRTKADRTTLNLPIYITMKAYRLHLSEPMVRNKNLIF